jgi:hypothetical protein
MFQRILIIKKAHMFLSFKTVPEEKYLRQTGADYLPPPTPPPFRNSKWVILFSPIGQQQRIFTLGRVNSVGGWGDFADKCHGHFFLL